MSDEHDAAPKPRAPAPLGYVEPHAGMLSAPGDEQLLYKIMTAENLIRSIEGQYLHFNRVDAYSDFPNADAHDGRQLPQDLAGNASSSFMKAPEFTAATYYDVSRSRTYACCFSLENSDYVWTNYAKGSQHGKVGVVFKFGKLRAMLNSMWQTAALMFNDIACRQVFSINYGIVTYVDWDTHRANAEHLPNPIQYTYLKGQQYAAEREVRISLSAIGLGTFVLNDGQDLVLPRSLRMQFDFRTAMKTGAIRKILLASDCDADYVKGELDRLHIAPASDAAVA